MREMKTGAVTQCRTLSHLFQLRSSSLVSITGTVRVSSSPAGLWQRQEEMAIMRNPPLLNMLMANYMIVIAT